MTGPIGVILLAAGRGRRFGSDKRAALLPDGRPLLAHTLDRYQSVFDAIVLVLRADDPIPAFVSKALLHDTVTVVRCPDADLGMGHSLATGAAHAVQAGWGGAFVALGDMPWVRVDTLRALRATLSARANADAPVIVQPELAPPGLIQGASTQPLPSERARAEDGQRDSMPASGALPGHPVGFSAVLLPELATLRGDAGARRVVAVHASSVVRVPVADPGVLADLDRPDQLPRGIP